MSQPKITDTKKPCRHNRGWCVVRNPCVWLSDDGIVRIGADKRGKVLATCNLSCGAQRNLYLRGQVLTLGKVRGSGAKPFSKKDVLR